MATEQIIQKPVYHWTCDYCGRVFTSGNSKWAQEHVHKCEEECRKALEEGKVRILLPPPGRYDTMFVEMHWRFVPADSPQTVCAKKGHDVVRQWEDGLPVGTEWSVATCKRCGEHHAEFQTSRKKKKPVRRHVANLPESRIVQDGPLKPWQRKEKC